MQLALKLSPSHVGTIMLPAGVVLALTIAGSGRLADRHPARLLVSFGLLLLASSFALMHTVGLTTTLWLLVALTILGRMGLGFIISALNLGTMRTLDKSLIAQGSSVINFIRMLGGATGISVCSIVLEWRLTEHGDSLQNPLTSPARLAAFNEAFLMLACLCTLALFAALQLRDSNDAASVTRTVID